MLPQDFYLGGDKSNGRRRQERDPDAMDIDVTETNGADFKPRMFKQITPEEKKHLLAEGRCFRCKKQGHLSQGCPDKSKGTIGQSVETTKQKLRMTETADESEEGSGSMTEGEDDADTSGPSKAFTVASRISCLTTNKRKEIFDHLQETLGPSESTAWLRSIGKSSSQTGIFRTSIGKIDTMNVPFTFQMAHAMANEAALLDRGATENFIDIETWKRMGIGKRPLVKPIKVYNVDGMENKRGEMTHYCRLRVIYDGEEDLQNFYLTNLGKD